MSEHSNNLGQPIGHPVTTVLPRPFPPSTPMSGQYCSVVPLDIAAHGPALHQANCRNEDGSNWTYMPYGPFDNEHDYIAWLEKDCTGTDPLFHTVLDSEGRPGGLASYLRIEPGAGCIEVGHIHFSPLLQRTPASTEAMYLMMQRVFDELGYRRYEWKCDALNAPSRSAAKRLGFQFEGIFRQATVYKGRNRDTAWFAIIGSEWPAIRAAYERWLDPDNFDESGQQRQPLVTRNQS